MPKMTGARLLVKCLEAQGVEYIFGIPGAKIDAVFDALLDSSIRLIVCRHEQNATFMAGIYGRITGKPGVVLVTSGPGITNMATGLLTATTEGDPIVALGGNVARSMRLKQSHQAMNNVALMKPVTKSSVEVFLAENIPEIVMNAFQIALEPQAGAAFISFPQDVLNDITEEIPLTPMSFPSYGSASEASIKIASQLINQAKNPLFLLGLETSRADNTQAIRQLLEKKKYAVIGTYQAAGVISKDLLDCFVGRVGLFKNQPGDRFIDNADVIIAIGFNPVEYDPEIWNANNKKKIIHINYNPCDIHNRYHPDCELLGNISLTLNQLEPHLNSHEFIECQQHIQRERKELFDRIAAGKKLNQTPIHPLRFIYELQQVVDDQTTICCDIGTNYFWMARYFLSYFPHQVLFSNGQQTLGVALPWAIGVNYARPNNRVISISGDGGFLFSATELETAVREKLKFIHFVWRDGSYNMVLEQEVMKYKRKSGVDLGQVNLVDFAKAFGAIGFELTDPNAFQSIFKEALKTDKPVLIDVPIDYSDNQELYHLVGAHTGH